MKQDKFLEEKIRLRKETDAEISQLASTAHAAAVAGLDATTRKTYKENVRLAEELSITKGENDRLNDAYAKTLAKATLLESQKTEAEMLAKQSVIKAKRHQQDMAALREKADKLETALSHCVREFERERALIIARTEEATEGTIADLSAAQRALKLKAAENKRIRHLAKYIVEQRSEMEVFFQESLMTVGGTCDFRLADVLLAPPPPPPPPRPALPGPQRNPPAVPSVFAVVVAPGAY